MKLVKLGDVCRVVSGSTPKRANPEYWGGIIPWVTPKEISKLGSPYLNDSIEKITELGFKSCSTEMLPTGSLLLSSRAPIGLLAINKKKVCTNQGFKSLVPSGQVVAEYLYYCLKSNVAALQAKGNGATFKELSKTSVEEFKIPLPPLDDQKRIAHLLGKVEELIARRKQHLQQLDDLLKGVFLEMFGDPVRNERGWDTKEITDVCDEIVDCVNKTAPKVEEETPFKMVRTSNIRGGKISLDNIKYVDAETYKIWTRRSKPRIGDILFTREAPMGEAGLIEFEDQIFLGQRIMQYRCNPIAAHPKFILELMKTLFFQRQIEKLGKGSTVKHLTVPDCFKFIVITPPLPIQNQFAAIVEKVEGLKSRYQQSLTDLGNIYGALSQKAFKGELDLSRVVLPVELTTEDTESTETHRQPKSFTQGFARQLLAAEILHRHNGHNMTQMKLQKLIHLAEHHAELDEIQGEYQRQAAGPYDNKMMYGIASSLKKQRWFETSGRGQNATYSPLANAGCHEKYLAHWRGKMVKVDEVLGLLGHASPDKCEIASTLYAAWNDLLIDGEKITDGRIIEQASKAELWHMTKEAIDPARWPKALQWMRDHDLVPTGYGKHTRKLK